jgi:hypothetical protein
MHRTRDYGPVEAAHNALRKAMYDMVAGMYPTHENAGPAVAVADAINELIEAHFNRRERKE